MAEPTEGSIDSRGPDLEFSQRFVANLVRNVNSAQAGHLAHQLNVPPNQRNQLEAEFPFNPAMVATRAVLFWQDNLAKGTFEDHRTILGRAFRACGMRRQASAVATYRARPTGEGERNVGAVPGPNGQEQRPLIGYLIQRGGLCPCCCLCLYSVLGFGLIVSFTALLVLPFVPNAGSFTSPALQGDTVEVLFNPPMTWLTSAELNLVNHVCSGTIYLTDNVNRDLVKNYSHPMKDYIYLLEGSTVYYFSVNKTDTDLWLFLSIDQANSAQESMFHNYNCDDESSDYCFHPTESVQQHTVGYTSYYFIRCNPYCEGVEWYFDKYEYNHTDYVDDKVGEVSNALTTVNFNNDFNFPGNSYFLLVYVNTCVIPYDPAGLVVHPSRRYDVLLFPVILAVLLLMALLVTGLVHLCYYKRRNDYISLN